MSGVPGQGAPQQRSVGLVRAESLDHISIMDMEGPSTKTEVSRLTYWQEAAILERGEPLMG